jgi:Sulfatase-modifying factor enzyme 1
MNLQEAWKKRWMRIVFALSVLAGLGTTLSYRLHRERVAEASRAAGAYCVAAGGEVAVNPQGPHSSLDPDESGVKKCVHRGGSYLCNDQYCNRYIAGARSKGETSTGTNHLGFRCVREAKTLPGSSAQAVVPSSR